MIFIILTHGEFGKELLKATEMIIGKQDNIEIISIKSNDSVNNAALELEEIFKKYNDEKYIIFTDMFGGSPSNISMAYLEKGVLEVVSGVNLPMLIKAFSLRTHNKTIEEISQEVAKAGRNNIKVAGELLNKV